MKEVKVEMKAFKNTTMTKSELLKELKIHQKMDNFIKGTYRFDKENKFKGCAVGCTIEALNRKTGNHIEEGSHYAYEKHFGVPMWLAKIEDRIFEGLPIDEAKKWPVRFTNAINIGSDLNKILRPFMVIICESSLNNFDHIKYPKIKLGIDLIIKLLKDKNSTKKQLLDARIKIRSDAAYAADAAAYAADAAAYAAAAYAAAAATYAAYAAAAATYAAAAADAADAANAAADAIAYANATVADADREKTYIFLSKELIKLIKECK